MEKLTQLQIKEIAEELDSGLIGYMNIKTGELLFMPDFDKQLDALEEFWEEGITKLKNDRKNFLRIDQLSSHESFKIMEDFAEQLSDGKLKSKLFDALNKRHPFREFKFLVDNSGPYRQEWFDFKSKELIAFLNDRLADFV